MRPVGPPDPVGGLPLPHSGAQRGAFWGETAWCQEALTPPLSRTSGSQVPGVERGSCLGLPSGVLGPAGVRDIRGRTLVPVTESVPLRWAA